MYAREFLESGNVIKANPVLARYRPLRFAMFFISIVMLALIMFLLFTDALIGGGHHLLYFTFTHGSLILKVSSAEWRASVEYKVDGKPSKAMMRSCKAERGVTW